LPVSERHRRRYMTSSVSGGNSHGSTPPPKTATCKWCAKVKSEAEAETSQRVDLRPSKIWPSSARLA